ncbi:MAG: NUDIX hydrolase [Nocardioides sp.]
MTPDRLSESGRLDLPGWLEPVREASARIRPEQLSGFLPPPDASPSKSAVLMLFADGDRGPELLLTERSHTMRSHPGQVSFPGGRMDPGEDAVSAALREAWEETGVDPSGVLPFGHLPELWLPPSNHAVTPILGYTERPESLYVASPAEVHAIHRVPIAELRDPAHRITVRHRLGFMTPGFWIGDGKDVILWGFTAGIIARLFEFLGWIQDMPDAPATALPDYMYPENDPRRTAAAGPIDDEVAE